MSEASQQVTIDVPIAAVYQQWMNAESFAVFVPAVSAVTASTEIYSHWTVTVGRLTREFDIEITEQLPEERVAWRTITGDLSFSGRADFEAAGDLGTVVTVTVDWTPGTAVERAAAALGGEGRAIRAVLHDFKAHVEKTGGPSGHSYVTLKSVDAEGAPGSTDTA